MLGRSTGNRRTPQIGQIVAFHRPCTASIAVITVAARNGPQRRENPSACGPACSFGRSIVISSAVRLRRSFLLQLGSWSAYTNRLGRADDLSRSSADVDAAP